MTLMLDKEAPAPAGCFVIENATWGLYERLLRDLDGQHISITYDDGRLALMSPLPIHEIVKTVTGRLIETTAMELDIPCACLGSTPWKRKDIRKGLEADECYYVQHEPQVRAKTKFDLKRDPAPDLAVEVDIRRHPLDRPGVYAALGVNELWRYDGKRIHFLKLGADGRYHPLSASEAFPFLTPERINHFLQMIDSVDQTTLVRRYRDWLRTLPEAK